MRSRAPGPPRPPTGARDVSNLGSVLHDPDDVAAVRAHYERAKFLGENHPNTVRVRRNLDSLT